MKVLSQSNAMQPGSDVWILADPAHSAWTRKLDWYLNFQIRRSRTHQPARISSELNEVMKTWEYDVDELKVDGSGPLMVASSQLLPNRQSIVVPFENLETWVKAIHGVYRNLDNQGTQTSLRVFLPERVSAQDFKRYWPEGDTDSKVELAADELLIKGA